MAKQMKGMTTRISYTFTLLLKFSSAKITNVINRYRQSLNNTVFTLSEVMAFLISRMSSLMMSIDLWIVNLSNLIILKSSIKMGISL